MGSIFGRKKQKKEETPRPEFEQISYGAAYSLLPYYLYGDEVGGNRELFLKKPRLAGLNLLVGTSMLAKFEPDEQFVTRFAETKGHSGQLCAGVQYRIVEYPKPATLNVGSTEQLENLDPERLMQKLASVVLAPYFSILLLTDELDIIEYLVLGQSLDGGTTLRLVKLEMNANLGPGCEPRLDTLLDFLIQRRESDQ